MAEHTDFEQSIVPENERKSFPGMFVVMLGFTFFSASMWTGATLGAGLTLKGFVIAVLCGNLILGVYTAVLAYLAGTTGLSLQLLSRYAFGRYGSFLPAFLLGITQIGWFGVGIAMFAIPVQMFLKAKGIECNVWIPVLISGAVMTASAYWGIKALTIVSIVSVPAIALGGGFSTIKVFADHPDAWSRLVSFTPDQANALSMGGAIALTVGSFISGGTCTPDFVRFVKNRKDAVTTTAIAFFIGNTLMFVFGAVGGMFYNTNDISNVLVAQGLFVPGIIVLGMNIWTTNDNALYSSGLAFSNITGLPKRYLVLFSGLIGTLLAVTLYNNFCGYLNMLNSLIPPVGAILAADFFVVRSCGKYYETLSELDKGDKVRLSAVVAWVAGAMVTNFVPFGISSINGMAVAFVLYCVWERCRTTLLQRKRIAK